MKINILAVMLWLLLPVTVGLAAEEMSVFPPAGEGVVRYVLPLPSQDDESLFKLELIVGKTVKIDAQNNYFFSGRIEEEKVQDWQGPLYRVTSLGSMTGTLMAVEPGTPQVDRFVTLGGAPYFIRYNSRWPVTIYVPEGVEVRYRLWSAGPEIRVAEDRWVEREGM